MGMESPTALELSPETINKLDELVVLLAKDRYGAAGPPIEITFTEIETYGHQAGRLVAQQVDKRLTGQHANYFQDSRPCPTCSHVCEREPKPHQLTMQTQDGSVGIDEPAFRCPTCDRFFFPSTPVVTD